MAVLNWFCGRATIHLDSRMVFWRSTRLQVSAIVSVRRWFQQCAIRSWTQAHRPTSSARSWMAETPQAAEMWSWTPAPRKLLSVNNGELWHHQCQVFAAKGLARCLVRIHCTLGVGRTKCSHGHRSDEDWRWRDHVEQPALCGSLCIDHL